MEDSKDYKKYLESLKDYKKYLELFSYKKEDSQEIIRKLFIGGLIYILVKNLAPIIINQMPFYGLTSLLIFLVSIINVVGILMILSGVCNVLYKVLRLIDLSVESKKEKRKKNLINELLCNQRGLSSFYKFFFLYITS